MTNKKYIVITIEKQLASTAGVKYLLNPQNFFVMDNPDILVTCGNRIFGIYVPTQFELANIDSLYRRIYLSRLTCAHDMRTILIMPDNDSFQKLSILKSAVHRVFCGDEVNEVASFVEGDQSNLSKRMLSKIVRAHAANNYYQYEELLSKLPQSFYNKFKILQGENWEQASPISAWSDYGKIQPIRNTFETSDALIFNRKKSKTSIKRSLDSLLNYTLFRQYFCDNGQLYVNQNETRMKILNTDLFASSGLDSIGISTLAYLGVLPVSIDSLDQFHVICNIGLDLFRK